MDSLTVINIKIIVVNLSFINSELSFKTGFY